MKNTLALWIIAACLLAQTVSVYRADTGGINIWVGSCCGWHIATD